MERFVNHLGLFAKYWLPGRVKTRLAATLGDEAACELYKTFLFHLTDSLAQSGDSRSVVFSPQEREPDFRQLVGSNWNLQAQSSGDLGQRMQTFFENCFRRSAELGDKQRQSVVVIGADCPQLSPRDVETAFAVLENHDAVIGPSTDGGYYLLGLNSLQCDVFSNMPWSTETVLENTIDRMRQQGVDYHLLGEKTDVDDEKSLGQLKSLLSQLSSSPSENFSRLDAGFSVDEYKKLLKESLQ